MNYKGVWGTISNHGWDIADAGVICRQLGYRDALQAIAYAARLYGKAFVAQPVWFSDVNCNGTEPSILNCSRSIVAGKYWIHDTDVGVVCETNRSARKLYDQSFNHGVFYALILCFHCIYNCTCERNYDASVVVGAR